MTAQRCQELDVAGQPCGGAVTSERDAEFVTFRCERCGTERAGHVRKMVPAVAQESQLVQAEIPDRFLGLRFEQDAENRPALEAVRSWLADAKNGLLPAPALHGKQGRGKSHLLAAICVRLVKDHDVPTLFRSTRGLLRELQRFEDPADRERALRRATTVAVLALDDLGAQRSTDWRHDELADLIDRRYEAERPIVIATNFPPRMWDQMLDARTASRLNGMTFPVELRGADRRQPRLPTGVA